MKTINYLSLLALLVLNCSCVDQMPNSLFCDGGTCPISPTTDASHDSGPDSGTIMDLPGVQVSIPQNNKTKEDIGRRVFYQGL